MLSDKQRQKALEINIEHAHNMARDLCADGADSVTFRDVEQNWTNAQREVCFTTFRRGGGVCLRGFRIGIATR